MEERDTEDRTYFTTYIDNELVWILNVILNKIKVRKTTLKNQKESENHEIDKLLVRLVAWPHREGKPGWI